MKRSSGRKQTRPSAVDPDLPQSFITPSYELPFTSVKPSHLSHPILSSSYPQDRVSPSTPLDPSVRKPSGLFQLPICIFLINIALSSADGGLSWSIPCLETALTSRPLNYPLRFH